jgi:16S rRNA (guanine527-N7)-methyltransferase
VTEAVGTPTELRARISALAERYRLPPAALPKLLALVERLAGDPLAPTSVRDPQAVIDRHLADSLVALELEPVRRAKAVLDLGSGAGLPGLPLAAALPEAAFVLLESTARKCAFLRRTAAACGFSNVEVVTARAESCPGPGRHDLVTARAVASLEVTAEYAAPLLCLGGTLVVWGGKRSADREAVANRAAAELGLSEPEVIRVQPFPEARDHHLYVMSKVMETPARFPRRPGAALKRPLGGAARRRGPAASGCDRG